MQASFAALAIVAVLAAAPARADEIASQLRFIGTDICTKSLEGAFEPFDAAEFGDWLAADGTSQGAFCGCVGELYASEGDAELLGDIQSELIADDSYFSLNFTMYDHMSSCRAAILEEDEVIDGDLAEFDPFSDPEALGYDHEDVRVCLQVFAGELPLPMPGFNADEALGQINASGQDLGAVCGCTAGYLGAQGASLQDAIANAHNPAQAYGAALQEGITLCAGL